MYQHDKELTAKFAADNPQIISNCRRNLSIPQGNYKGNDGNCYHNLYIRKTTDNITCPVCGGTMTWANWR